MPIVIIDCGYYNFYRFHATVKWYNYSPERRAAAEGLPWLENPTFMKTFKKMWFETIKKLCKKFSVSEAQLIFARDGSNVWRYDVYPKYKATRDYADSNNPHSPGPVFKYVNRNFYNQLSAATVIRIDTAEADDIAAVATNYIRTVTPHQQIVIITSDHDLLQISEPGWVDIYQLKGWKKITTSEPHIALMRKILAGDPSDNIPPIYKGCGKKTAERLAKNPQELETILCGKGHKQYLLNYQLVNFDCIPDHVVSEIESLLDDCLKN